MRLKERTYYWFKHKTQAWSKAKIMMLINGYIHTCEFVDYKFKHMDIEQYDFKEVKYEETQNACSLKQKPPHA